MPLRDHWWCILVAKYGVFLFTEIGAFVFTDYTTLPDDYMILTIDIPDDIKIKQLTETDLPEDWQEFPHPFSTQNIGREFVTENEFCVLIIPSVVTQGDYNVLINPNHIDFSKIKISSTDKFPFDKRIFN